jgi:hypothetical protein
MSRPAPARYRGSMGDEDLRTCAWCGLSEPVARTLSWSTSTENGRPLVYCDTCSREHLRSMEGKLDSEFW